MMSLTLALNQNHFMFRLDDSTVNAFVYGNAMTADNFANRRTRLPNIFLS